MKDLVLVQALKARRMSSVGLARALAVSHQAVNRWRAVPQDRLFEAARAIGAAPEQLRPDLADWIAQERGRQRFAAARAQHSLVKAAAPAAAGARRGLDQHLVDTLTTLAAVRFVAGERVLALGLVIAGRRRPEMGARSWAMALAHVAGGASCSVVGPFFETSKQNVQNASERYLRARDGDDPEDFILGNDGRERVIERGRLRPAKAGLLDLWAAETRFRAVLDGDLEERKRA